MLQLTFYFVVIRLYAIRISDGRDDCPQSAETVNFYYFGWLGTVIPIVPELAKRRLWDGLFLFA
jgi:hypothetical protein